MRNEEVLRIRCLELALDMFKVVPNRIKSSELVATAEIFLNFISNEKRSIDEIRNLDSVRKVWDFEVKENITKEDMEEILKAYKKNFYLNN